MEVTEGFVLLTDHPSLVIEVYLDHVFSVLSIVYWVNINPRLLNADAQRNLEEVGPVVPIVFVACLDMINEHL